jgi:hypothetical protein
LPVSRSVVYQGVVVGGMNWNNPNSQSMWSRETDFSISYRSAKDRYGDVNWGRTVSRKWTAVSSPPTTSEWNAENPRPARKGRNYRRVGSAVCTVGSAPNPESGCFVDHSWYPISSRYEIMSIHLPP